MLKPSDTWSWFFDEQSNALMLDLGNDAPFKVSIPKKLLVDCAYTETGFTVDDATAFQTYKEQAAYLDLPEEMQQELVLNCAAAKRFHKPVQPKSWFFDSQSEGQIPEEGDIVHLKNSYGEGFFMVIEVCENASLCALVEKHDFILDGRKALRFGEPIKVMHNRMLCANHYFQSLPVALVG